MSKSADSACSSTDPPIQPLAQWQRRRHILAAHVWMDIGTDARVSAATSSPDLCKTKGAAAVTALCYFSLAFNSCQRQHEELR